PPAQMRDWITKQFGSVDAVLAQEIVRVTNLVTLEGALFNDLRARRPVEVKGADEVRETIERSRNDPFCHPETGTPADTFGRIRGEHGITASNVAKYDGYHGVLVFDEHDPLAPMDAEVIRDRLLTSRRWALAATDEDPSARLRIPCPHQRARGHDSGPPRRGRDLTRRRHRRSHRGLPKTGCRCVQHGVAAAAAERGWKRLAAVSATRSPGGPRRPGEQDERYRQHGAVRGERGGSRSVPFSRGATRLAGIRTLRAIDARFVPCIVCDKVAEH